MFTEPLPSNNIGIHIRVHIHRLMEEFVKYSVEMVSAGSNIQNLTGWGGIHRHKIARRSRKSILIFTKQEHKVNKRQFQS
jgi:hypothetical protein